MQAETLQTKSRSDLRSSAGPVAPRHPLADSAAVALLFTELFPPAVGGTPVLFEAIYSRLTRTSVTVLADDGVAGPTAVARHMSIVRRPTATRRWGVLDPKGLWHHVKMARALRKLQGRRDVVVHCARALPEGVAAFINRRLGGPEYICWAHGEEITTASHSREFTLMMRRVYGGAAALVANSRNTARMLEEQGIPPSRIAVVYPGVDVRRFRPDVSGSDIRTRYSPNGELVVLSVGRLQRRKGHDLAIAAVGLLRPTMAVRYLIAGDGEERPRLERLAADHGVRDQVEFLGEVSARELPRYYAASDIFLMPNRIENRDVEGFGIVFLEAAATGRPAIGGSNGGVPEAVVHNETGILVSGTDAAELAGAIRHLASSSELRVRLGAAGRARVCRDFTWERAAIALEAVHARVADARYRSGS